MRAMIWAAWAAAGVFAMSIASARAEPMGPYRLRIGTEADFLAFEVSLAFDEAGVTLTTCSQNVRGGAFTGSRDCFDDGPLVPSVDGDLLGWEHLGDRYVLDMKSGRLFLYNAEGVLLGDMRPGAIDFSAAPLAPAS